MPLPSREPPAGEHSRRNDSSSSNSQPKNLEPEMKDNMLSPRVVARLPHRAGCEGKCPRLGGWALTACVSFHGWLINESSTACESNTLHEYAAGEQPIRWGAPAWRHHQGAPTAPKAGRRWRPGPPRPPLPAAPPFPLKGAPQPNPKLREAAAAPRPRPRPPGPRLRGSCGARGEAEDAKGPARCPPDRARTTAGPGTCSRTRSSRRRCRP